MADIQVQIANDGRMQTVAPGATLGSFAPREVPDPKTGKMYPVLAALVDHKLKALDFQVFFPHEIESYARSLSFLAQVAARHLFPEKVFKINHSLPSGMYCKFRAERISDEDILRMREEMMRLIALDLPFSHHKMLASEAIELFEGQNQRLKAGVIRSLGRHFWTVYCLDGITDNFYGPLVPSTGYLKVFDLMPFHHGFCLQHPMQEDITRVVPRLKQKKLAITLKEYGHWCKTTGIVSVSALNQRLLDGKAVELINLCEARQEREYANLADKIYAERDRVKIVFLAGPSSSGKTSSSLRVAQQLKVVGMNPKVIELDNYFVARELTPKDDDGNYDFEALEAMDLELLGHHLNTLLAGGEVELPRYDFKQGRPFFEGKMMHLEGSGHGPFGGPHPHLPHLCIGPDLPQTGRKLLHFHHGQPHPAAHDPGQPCAGHLTGRYHPPVAFREERGNPVHLPLPGKCRFPVQYGPAVRAAFAPVLCGTSSAPHHSGFPGLCRGREAAQIPGVCRSPEPG